LENLELIEAYYSGELAESERQDFEIRLLVDAELKEEYERYVAMVQAMRETGEEKVRARLAEIDRKLDQGGTGGGLRSPSGKKKLIVPVLVAACLLLIFFMVRPVSLNSYESHIPYEEGLPVLMSSVGSKAFNDAMSAFRDSRFTEALPVFQHLSNEQPRNDTILYFLANAELRLGKFAEARLNFEKLAGNDESVYRYKAQFYQALSCWALDENELARELFTMISGNAQHPMRNEALHALEDL
jgi:tetratricopeptide (TPR) repeat protein